MRNSTTRTLCVAAILTLGAAAAPARAASPACEAKRVQIESSLADAQARGQAREVRGLKKALAANKSSCTDAGLEKERQSDIRAAQKEVDQRETDLKQAQRKGDAEKIEKRQAKLDEARAELERANRPIPH